jgi:hypothetical protein
MLVFPELRLWKPTSSSFAVWWFSSSHARNVAAVAKKLGLTIAELQKRPGSQTGARFQVQCESAHWASKAMIPHNPLLLQDGFSQYLSISL